MQNQVFLQDFCNPIKNCYSPTKTDIPNQYYSVSFSVFRSSTWGKQHLIYMNTVDFDKYKNVGYKTQIRPLLVKINDSVIIQEPCGSTSLPAVREAIKLSNPRSLFSPFLFFLLEPSSAVIFGTTPCPGCWGWKSCQMILPRACIHSEHNET